MGEFVKQNMREWYPSTTGPLLPTMTDSLLAPGREVLHKRYNTGELVEAIILGPSMDGDDFVIECTQFSICWQLRMVLCYLGLNGRCKIYHCLQGGALATINMTGHGGKSSLSTQAPPPPPVSNEQFCPKKNTV